MAIQSIATFQPAELLERESFTGSPRNLLAAGPEVTHKKQRRQTGGWNKGRHEVARRFSALAACLGGGRLLDNLPYLMNLFRFVCAVACFAASAGVAVAQAAQAVAEPPTSWVDPETGHRVIRLTREPGSASLYFNESGYTPDGKRMIYMTREGISVLDLRTFETKPVGGGAARAIGVGQKTPTVYFRKPGENALFSTNLDTGETRKIADLPRRGGISTINADETLPLARTLRATGWITIGGRPARTAGAPHSRSR